MKKFFKIMQPIRRVNSEKKFTNILSNNKLIKSNSTAYFKEKKRKSFLKVFSNETLQKHDYETKIEKVKKRLIDDSEDYILELIDKALNDNETKKYKEDNFKFWKKGFREYLVKDILHPIDDIMQETDIEDAVDLNQLADMEFLNISEYLLDHYFIVYDNIVNLLVDRGNLTADILPGASAMINFRKDHFFAKRTIKIGSIKQLEKVKKHIAANVFDIVSKGEFLGVENNGHVHKFVVKDYPRDEEELRFLHNDIDSSFTSDNLIRPTLTKTKSEQNMLNHMKQIKSKKTMHPRLARKSKIERDNSSDGIIQRIKKKRLSIKETYRNNINGDQEEHNEKQEELTLMRSAQAKIFIGERKLRNRFDR
jgi:hypothetical protein